ncbi:MAG: hypothetical protein J0L62_01145 [Bacteroidetes bacterium]|nr:hypothetical protein [Bacteroidota bacterium]
MTPFQTFLISPVLALLISLSPSKAFSDDLSLAEMRKQFYLGVKNQDLTESFLKRISAIEKPTAIELAYKAAAQALMGKHVWNPVKKLDWLDLGSETMKKAVSMDPENVEIRFLRFTWQHHLPGFLNRSTDLEADRKVILAGLKSGKEAQDPQLKKNVITFLLESGRCSPSEETILRQIK